MTTTTTALSFDLPEADVKNLKADAANARAEGRLDSDTSEFWDYVVKVYGKGKDPKRAAILKAVLTACGEWKSTPQVGDDKARTPFGNVVQRFGARFDAAVKRVTPDEPKPVTLRAVLSGEGGGSTTIPADHPLYDALVTLIGAQSE